MDPTSDTFPLPPEPISAPKRRFLLPDAATKILKDYYAESHSLARTDKEDLLHQIRAIEGAEEYTAQQLTRWFNSRKGPSHRRRIPATAPRCSVADLLFPSITPKVHDSLLILFSDHRTGNPNPDLIDFWADCLTKREGRVVAANDVATWVRHQQALNAPQEGPSGSKSIASRAPYRPLTPAESTSPEPPGAFEASPLHVFTNHLEPEMKVDSPVVPQWEILDRGRSASYSSLDWQPSSMGSCKDSLRSLSPDLSDADHGTDMDMAMDVDEPLPSDPPYSTIPTRIVSEFSSPAPEDPHPNLYATHEEEPSSQQQSRQSSPAPLLPSSSCSSPLSRYTPTSDVIRNLNLAAISMTPSAASSSTNISAPSRSPPPQNISEVSSRMSPFASGAQRFIDLLESGKLEGWGWPRDIAAGGDDLFSVVI